MSAEANASGLKRLAERLWEYEPTAVLQEPDGALRAYKGEALRSAMAAAQADERAPVVLYDLFSAPNNERAVAIQATEDASMPRDLKFYCNGKLMPHQEVARHPDPCLLAIQQIQISPSPVIAPLRMTVETGGHATEIDIPPYPFTDWREVTLTQVVVEKDYPMVWVRDHALFHHRAHGYERLIVYDNGSSNVAELKDCLAQLDEGLEVLLIRWPFPMYRPRIQKQLDEVYGKYSSYHLHDTCSQLAAYNHHLYLLAPRSTYVSHFDLDEYLLNRSEKSLADHLNELGRGRDVYHLWTERVANVTTSHSDAVRAADFKWQSRDQGIRESDLYYKYIYRAKPLFSMPPVFALVHGITLSSPSLHSEESVSLRRLIHYVLLKSYLWGAAKFCYRRAKDLIGRFRPQQVNSQQAPKHELVLFHYDGVRTNWGDSIKVVEKSVRGARLPFDSEQHKLHDEMPKLLARLGLADKDD